MAMGSLPPTEAAGVGLRRRKRGDSLKRRKASWMARWLAVGVKLSEFEIANQPRTSELA